MRSIFSTNAFTNEGLYSKIITNEFRLLQIKLANYTISAKDVEISIKI